MKTRTSIKPGEVRNPGGLTKEHRAARDALNNALSEPERQAVALKSYDALLAEGNPIIVKDYFDRVAGKPKEHVEINGAARPYEALSDDVLIAFVMARLGIEKLKAEEEAAE